MNWSPRASKRTKMAPLSSGGSFDEIITNYINKNDVMMFSKSWCPFCAKVKALFAKLNITATILELDQEANGDELQAALLKISGQKTVPNVYIKGKHLGGCDDTLKAHEEGKLVPMIDENPYDYDLIVIGGGSGGLSASKRAASYGKKVAVCDYVKPTPLGTTWGLGGTCVNVGCIPKKLMHQAALLGGAIKDARSFGWATPEETEHRWTEMVESVQNHIGSLNWGYRVALREKNVQYLNQYAEFVDQHTVKLKNKRGKEVTATSNNFLICVGERPKYPDIPGAKEYCITSDDLFSLPSSPGKTLVIGASYVALECAGFLHGIGLDVSVMVRSIYLRGFDQQMAEKVGEYMEKEGIKVLKKFVPLSIEMVREKTDDQPQLLRVKSEQTAADGGVPSTAGQEEYNTVLLAIGRESVTSSIGLHNVGLKPGRNGKLATDEWDCTSVPNIFCIGDNALGTPELTPVAIQAGKLLADRLYGGSTVKCDYKTVPTTVFTPLEYSCCGYSEEDAIEKFGEQNLEVYHTNAWPLEWTVTGNPLRDSNTCYAKIITNLNDNERIVGIHYLGPNAGEVMQGFAVAMKCGVTKEQLDSTIGIHPTNAEILTTLDVTKRSAGDIQQAGC